MVEDQFRGVAREGGGWGWQGGGGEGERFSIFFLWKLRHFPSGTRTQLILTPKIILFFYGSNVTMQNVIGSIVFCMISW